MIYRDKDDEPTRLSHSSHDRSNAPARMRALICVLGGLAILLGVSVAAFSLAAAVEKAISGPANTLEVVTAGISAVLAVAIIISCSGWVLQARENRRLSDRNERLYRLLETQRPREPGEALPE
jgi:hypothetical protein